MPNQNRPQVAPNQNPNRGPSQRAALRRQLQRDLVRRRSLEQRNQNNVYYALGEHQAGNTTRVRELIDSNPATLVGHVDATEFRLRVKPNSFYQKQIDAANEIKAAKRLGILDSDTFPWFEEVSIQLNQIASTAPNQISTLLAQSLDGQGRKLPKVHGARGVYNFILAWQRVKNIYPALDEQLNSTRPPTDRIAALTISLRSGGARNNQAERYAGVLVRRGDVSVRIGEVREEEPEGQTVNEPEPIGGSTIEPISRGGSIVEESSIGGSIREPIPRGGYIVESVSVGGSGAEANSRGSNRIELQSTGGSGAEANSRGSNRIELQSTGGSGAEPHSRGSNRIELESTGGSGAEANSRGSNRIELQSTGGSGEEANSRGSNRIELQSTGGSGSEANSRGSNRIELESTGGSGEEADSRGSNRIELQSTGGSGAEANSRGSNRIELESTGGSGEEANSRGSNRIELESTGGSGEEADAGAGNTAEQQAVEGSREAERQRRGGRVESPRSNEGSEQTSQASLPLNPNTASLPEIRGYLANQDPNFLRNPENLLNLSRRDFTEADQNVVNGLLQGMWNAYDINKDQLNPSQREEIKQNIARNYANYYLTNPNQLNSAFSQLRHNRMPFELKLKVIENLVPNTSVLENASSTQVNESVRAYSNYLRGLATEMDLSKVLTPEESQYFNDLNNSTSIPLN